MKTILEFNMPEDADDLKLAENGAKLQYAVDEYDNWLRGLAKYENRRTISIDLARQKLLEYINKYLDLE